jgi:hypothetical protein
MNLASKAELEHFMQSQPLHINNKSATTSSTFTHLGIQRNSKGSALPTFEAIVTSARRTLYSLMGAELHGFNSLPVEVCLHLYKVYIIPCATYGIEAITFSIPSIKPLEMFHRSCLRNILSLPQCTAIPAHIVTDRLLMEAVLDIKVITFLHSLLATPGPTREVVIQQYIMKASPSWVTQARTTLRKSSLPSLSDLAFSDSSKEEWKKVVKQAIYNKSSLSYLAPNFTHGTVHSCISSARTPREVTRANVKLRLLTGSYNLQKQSLKFKEKSDSSCPICNAVEENTQHFLLDCPPLEDVRVPYMRFIK